MLFTEILKAIRPHLMNDATEAVFMRNIIQMLCDVPEKDWGKKNDPSSEQNYQDTSLRKFYSRGITKTLAKKILAHLTKKNFIESINTPDREDIILEGLATDIAPFAPNITKDNVAEKLFDLLVKGLKECVNPELQNTRLLSEAKQKSDQLKGIYGSGLLEDCMHSCSMPDCGHSLQTLTDDGRSADDYEIILINAAKPAAFPNICAVCHNCFQKYTLSHPAKKRTELIASKTGQINYRIARKTLSESNIDEGITSVVKSLMYLKAEDLKQLNYEPVPITKKISEKNTLVFIDTIKNYVTKYYFPIKKCMQDLSRLNQYSDERIRTDIRAIYLRLESKGLSQEVIYNQISQKIQRVTKQDLIYCNIVVCYFIQSCEVFHDITK